MTTEKIPNIHQRMLGVMKDVAYIQKEDKAAKGLPYKFISHDKVTGALHPAFVTHGILCISNPVTFRQDGNRTEMEVLVSYINVDNPDDKIEVKSWGYGIDGQDKGPGKAISYATKMAHLKSFMLETGEDPERDNIDYQPNAISPEELIQLREKINEIIDKGIDFNEEKFKEFFKCYDYQKMTPDTFKLAMLQLNNKLNGKSKVTRLIKEGQL